MSNYGLTKGKDMNRIDNYVGEVLTLDLVILRLLIID